MGLSAQLPRYAERIGRERRRAEAKRPVPEASHVDCPAGGEGGVIGVDETTVRRDKPKTAPNGAPTASNDGASDVPTAPNGAPEPPESHDARAAGDYIACETPVRGLVVVSVKRQRHECRGYVVEQRIQTRSPASVVICTRRTVGRPAAYAFASAARTMSASRGCRVRAAHSALSCWTHAAKLSASPPRPRGIGLRHRPSRAARFRRAITYHRDLQSSL
jgi:hypothetical protein